MKAFLKITQFSLIILMITTLSCSNNSTKETPAPAAALKLYYNPSIFKRLIPADENSAIADALSSSILQIEISAYDVPYDFGKYNFEMFSLGKNHALNFIKADADIGIVNTFEYLDLFKFDPNIRPIAYFSEESKSEKEVCSQDSQLVTKISSPIKEISDLNNKKIALLSPEQTGLFPAKAFLIDNQIPLANIRIVTTVKELKSVLENGEVDAALDSYFYFSISKSRLGFFKSELSPFLKAKDMKYKSLFITNNQFPCHLIYAKRSVSNLQVSEFLKNFKNALSSNKLQFFKINNITSSINSKNLKKMEDVSTANLDFYQGKK